MQSSCLLNSLTQDSMSVSSYFTRLKEIWEEYSVVALLPSCTCTSSIDYAKIVQQQRLFQFLMGLNSSYQSVRSQMLLMNPLPTVNQAYSMVCKEETQRTLSSSPSPLHTEGSTMAARGRGRFGRGGARENPSEECSYCHRRRGHERDECFQLVGFPPNFQRGRGRGNQVRQIPRADHADATTANSNGNSMVHQPQECQLLSQQDYTNILKMLKNEATDIGAVVATDPKGSTGSLQWERKNDW
ncbi:uncharacterized protein LOC129307314 [Prosopis cineraria]|uniref:uncharacterized protein LOC129307314 n=1 Tax=Prosopis cineraria TaxID=364024 RepID=UPI00240F8FB3|nr:uncharacterized protein LOC129307314 [Prosopis cineraria]